MERDHVLRSIFSTNPYFLTNVNDFTWLEG